MPFNGDLSATERIRVNKAKVNRISYTALERTAPLRKIAFVNPKNEKKEKKNKRAINIYRVQNTVLHKCHTLG